MSAASAPGIESQWICCQLSARDHYVVPRALHRRGSLRALITDAWVPPGSPIAWVPVEQARRLSDRYHPELASAPVRALTASLVRHEIGSRLQRPSDWDAMIARNQWFMAEAARQLRALEAPTSQPATVFAHSYAALDVLREAKQRGWATVLGQIDAGEAHFAAVARACQDAPQYGPAPAAPPPEYFADWREECRLADRIIVNSEWSCEGLVRAGIEARKLEVVPLPYEGAVAVTAREYPGQFTVARPLRLLFVGSVSTAKGAAALVDAMAHLRDRPVVLRLVGPLAMSVPETARLATIEFAGPVPRSDVMRYYDEADLLVFPSHSDGFGLVQAEARARGLPVLASHACGRVVDDGVTGLLLDVVSPAAIAGAVTAVLDQPGLLATLSRNAASSRPFSVDDLGQALAVVAGS
jgi:glycosyltransferase involved in cell wall biosynthesis